MQIRTTRKGLEALKCKFEPFERDSKHSNPNSNHSKGIQSIRMQIRNTRKGLEAFDCKFEAFECKFEPLERDWKHSSAN